MANVVIGTAMKRRKKTPAVAVRKAGHPAAFRKVRCLACHQGYAIQDPVDKTRWVCARCGAAFTQRVM